MLECIIDTFICLCFTTIWKLKIVTFSLNLEELNYIDFMWVAQDAVYISGRINGMSLLIPT